MTARVRSRRRCEPEASTAITGLGGAHHIDAVAIDVAPGMSAVQLTMAVLASTPVWVKCMVSVRDALVRPFGLHTRVRVPPSEIALAVGRRLGPFVVMAVADDEVLLGDDDRHLRFRASFAVRDRADGAGTGREGVCTTVVVYNNIAGRLYFTAIKPFHNVIVAAMVSRAASSV